MKIRYLLVLSFVIALSSSAAVAAPFGGAGAIARAVGHCGNPCTIVRNTGGRIVDFEDAGNAIRAGKQKLVIDGYCASACMVMADRARPRTCITSRAVFGYHKTNFGRPIPLRGDLHGWIMRHGGYPKFGTTPGTMPNSVARQFFPACRSDSVASAF
jgi:hypothetical protein